MRLVTFESGGEDRVGAWQGNSVIDVGLAVDWLRRGALGAELRAELRKAVDTVVAGASPGHMIDLLERGEAWRRALGQILATGAASPGALRIPQGVSTPLEKVRLRAPIPRPGKIVCVGLNY